MRATIRRLRRLVGGAVGAALLATAPGCGDDQGFDVLPPGAVVDGDDDAVSLLGRYWKGMLEAPRDRAARSDPSRCRPGLPAHTVYFAPTAPTADSGVVRCTVPEGTTVVVLPASVVCVEEGFDQADVACLESMWNLTSSSVVVDGRAEAELTQYEVDSEQFDVDLDETDTAGMRPGPLRAIARGQVVMLAGLSRGSHVIEVAARFGDERTATLIIELEVQRSAG